VESGPGAIGKHVVVHLKISLRSLTFCILALLSELALFLDFLNCFAH